MPSDETGAITWQQFIDATPVGETAVVDLKYEHQIASVIVSGTTGRWKCVLPPVELSCPCTQHEVRLPHEVRTDFFLLLRNGPHPECITYFCRACCQHSYTIAVIHDSPTTDDYRRPARFKKIGQDPPMSGVLPKPLRKVIGKDNKESKWLARGRDCANYGHGIAALAYYRLVLESIIDRLLNAMLTHCETQPQRDAVEAALKEIHLHDKLKKAKDGIPKGLMVPGADNPLNLLMTCFNDDLHAENADDSTALKKATHSLDIVAEMLGFMQDDAQFRSSLSESMKQLGKIVNPQQSEPAQ